MNLFNTLLLGVFAGASVVALSGCQSRSGEKQPLAATQKRVDLPRFMGDWYVIANIPTFIEKGAHNAVERYDLRPDGKIATTFTFNKGSFEGPKKEYHPVGTIRNRETNAEWGMQFVWPFQADYLIAYVDDDYQTTIIGVPKRKYVWIMARTPTLPEAVYNDLVKRVQDMGYDLSRLQKVPQQATAR